MSESSQNNTKNGKLLPCYFCGGEAEVCECGINGKMRVYGLVEHKDGCFFLADGLPTKYQYIMESDFDAWNTRADDYKQAAEYWQQMYEQAFAEQTCKLTLDGTDGCFGCSRCYENIPPFSNYCPNCGARVVGE